MCTFLGIAGKINENDVDVSAVKNSEITFLDSSGNLMYKTNQDQESKIHSYNGGYYPTTQITNISKNK